MVLKKNKFEAEKREKRKQRDEADVSPSEMEPNMRSGLVLTRKRKSEKRMG